MNLTESEKEILKMVGLSNKEIAQRRVIAICTVKTHINHLLNKINANNRTLLICKAVKMGLLKPEQLITE